ncbi:DUF4097 family beta strand repeat-containing protein [Alteromonas oceanisediminis]|uniref:DUF4097 family beta strand repeat-containing protein n=1 Tax=Alteromonas oceanisediminis TaxID=2836180 RepID=UPI001BDAE77E|nr:DUF4097 family beta strand repeat-containing protein [Alteromonas oceanisediminis]MBT0586716.1 DUF4097 family beta strand repeat protein [Alteromonas oceanisediminis]
MLKKSPLLLVTTTVVALSVSTIILANETIEREFTVDAQGTLLLKTDTGKIIINTHSQNTIVASVDIEGPSADDFEVTFEEKDKGLQIVGEREGDWSGNNRVSVSYSLTLPENYDVDLFTSGGAIRIDDLNGNVDAKTSGGSIGLNDIVGDVDIHTSGGSISVDNVEGDIDAHTSGGSIKVSFQRELAHDVDFSTSGGSIKAYLPKGTAFDVDASTSGGYVKTDFTVDGKVTKRAIEGQVNGGGKELTLKTSGGGIKVIQR